MPSRWRGAGAIGLAGAGASFIASTLALAVGARVMARIPLLPAGREKSDAVVRAAFVDRVHLDATPETRRPGVLAIRQGGGALSARLGAVTGHPTPTTVARPLLALDADRPGARLEAGAASTNGYFWAGDPMTAHGLAFEEVDVPSPVGAMPAWLVPPGDDEAADGARSRGSCSCGSCSRGTWAVIVHGHGATRGESLRLLPLLHRLGITALAITYRNDAGAAASADRMMHLGAAEWEDAEAAVAFALEHGARRVVLIGLSMGGGIALRTSVLSAHREQIAALVLDSPAVDWHDILDHHARALKAPRPLRALALWMMRSPWGARGVRLHEPIALEQMHAPFYAEHLSHPTLLLHAMADTTVPPAPSAVLAHLRPDLVRFEPFAQATHTREWNTDPERCERIVAGFLDEVLGLGIDVERLVLPVRDPAAPPQERSSGRRL